MAYTIDTFNLNRGVPWASTTSAQRTIHTYYSATDNVATILTGGYFSANFGFVSGYVAANDVVNIIATDGVVDAIVVNASTPTLNQISAGNPFDQDLDMADSPTFSGLTLSSIANDNTETKLMVLDSGTNQVQYRTVASLPGTNPFDQNLNTTNDVLFNSVQLPSTGSTPTPLDFYSYEFIHPVAFSGPFAANLNVSFLRIGNLISVSIATLGSTLSTSTTQLVATGVVPVWARPFYAQVRSEHINGFTSVVGAEVYTIDINTSGDITIGGPGLSGFTSGQSYSFVSFSLQYNYTL